MSKETPYTRLLEAVRRYVSAVKHPRRVTMWHYPKARLDEGWSLANLYQRTTAADQVGYDVILKATENGLEVVYQKRPPEIEYFIG